MRMMVFVACSVVARPRAPSSPFALGAISPSSLPARAPSASRSRLHMGVPRLSDHSHLIPSAEQLYSMMIDVGRERCAASSLEQLLKALAAGMFIGTGGILCSSVGADLLGPGLWEAGRGLQRIALGLVGFPLSSLLIAITGSSAFTGNIVFTFAALRARATTLRAALRLLLVTYVGCFVGACSMGALCAFSALPAASPAAAIAVYKLGISPGQLFLRGIGGGWCIGLGVALATAAANGGGSIADVAMSVLLPVSAYVMCQFEHCLANMFFFSTALFTGHSLSLATMLQSLLFTTAGNIVGGLIVAAMALLPWSEDGDRSTGFLPPAVASGELWTGSTIAG